MASSRDPVRSLLRVGVRAALAVVVLSLLVLVALFFVGRQELRKRELVAAGGQHGQTSASGGRDFAFKVPSERKLKRIEDADTAAPLRLIPERQRTPMPVERLPEAEMAPLRELVERFVASWETFEPSEGAQAFRLRLAPLVVPDRLEEIAARVDDHRPTEVGVCAECSVGSRYERYGISAGEMARVRMSNPEEILVTTQAIVTLSGDDPLLGSRSFRRSYSLLLARYGSGWRVTRAVADTLGPA